MKRVCALGFFDGVHLGHAAIINNAIELASELGAYPAVVTFDKRPKNLLEQNPAPLISDIRAKKTLVNTLFSGVEVIELSFSNELIEMAPQDFVREILIKKLNAVGAVVGEDFRFGKGAAGTSVQLESLVATRTIKTVCASGKIVSSSAIRKLIIQGEMGQAVAMLGHAHLICGEVQHGDARGRKLGFATINLEPNDCVIKPKPGVYASRVSIDGKLHDAVSSLGTRPTFYEEGPYLYETHILGLAESLYGRIIELWLYELLRPEIKFLSADELISAMNKDVENAVNVLSHWRNGPKI